MHNIDNCTIPVYRGVPENGTNGVAHPGFDAATEGVATPRGGTASAEAHQAGTTDSPYVSWTTSPQVAARRAMSGQSGYGVVIESRIPAGMPHIHVNDEPWADPDMRSEFEVLIEGELSGTPRLVGPGLG